MSQVHLNPLSCYKSQGIVRTYNLRAWQGQSRASSGQPGLVVGDPAHGRGLKLDDHCGTFQPRPFCDSKIFWGLTPITYVYNHDKHILSPTLPHLGCTGTGCAVEQEQSEMHWGQRGRKRA